MLFTDHRDIRTAVMGTFTVLYLGFVSATFNTEFVAIMDDRDGMGRHVYDSFNTFMLVMLGFYFSGKAVEMVTKTRTNANGPDDTASAGEPAAATSSVGPADRKDDSPVAGRSTGRTSSS